MPINRNESKFAIRDSGDAHKVREDDYVYVVSRPPHFGLLAKFHVKEIRHELGLARFIMDISSPETTYFAGNDGYAVPDGILEEIRQFQHRDVCLIEDEFGSRLEAFCEMVNDFSVSSPVLPLNWKAVVGRLERVTHLAMRDRDARSGMEVAFDYLRKNYFTSELPGPRPVYLNAARLAFQNSLLPSEPASYIAPRTIRKERFSEWGTLTDEAIEKGINDDSSMFEARSPNSRMHQRILRVLRDRLIQLGFSPQYNGFVDCKISTENEDIYFEVKSASAKTFVHQMRLGIGQLSHYIWKDSMSSTRPISGFLVIEDVNAEIEFEDFAKSLGFRTCLSSDIPGLIV